MINIIKIFLLLLFSFSHSFAFSYISRFHMISRNNIRDTAINFMNLNEILNDSCKRYHLNIHNYNNKSLCFNYETFSYVDDYRYKNIYLLKDKTTYLASYKFKIDDSKYKYLILIKTKMKTKTRTIMDIYVKYNQIIINKKINDYLIYKTIYSCVNKKQLSNINEILEKYFQYGGYLNKSNMLK